MLSYPFFTLGLLLVVFPGIYCWTVLFPNDSAAQRLAWGSVLGLAAAVYVAYVCAFADLRWFYAVWPALLISVGSFAWWHTQRRLSLRDLNETALGSVMRLSSVSGESREAESSRPATLSTGHGAGFSTGLAASPNAALALLLLMIVVLQTVAVMNQSVPSGWDPSFHLLLAKKIALSDHLIRDWQPFESAALNYPLGSHFLIVLFARFSGLPLPRVFQFLMVTFSMLSALAVYALASEYFASEIVGLYAAIAYGFWAWYGSTDYLRWGGLPNQLGMLLGLGILGLVVRAGEQRKGTVLMAVLFTSVCLTHHHVMFTMGSILIVLALFFLATNDSERRYRTIFFALAMSAVAAAFFLFPYALKAASLSQTSVFHIDDDHRWLDFTGLGLGLVAFALAGAALDYFRKETRSHVFHCVSATLLLLYLLFGPVYYFYQVKMTGEGFVAFTPSRFTTDLVYFLSLFAGYCLYRLQKFLGWSAPTMVAIALALAFVNRGGWEHLLAPDRASGRFAAYGWVADHTPANSILMTTDPWACYAAWRRTLGTPMPASEPSVPPRISERANLELLAGRSPKELRGIQLLAVFGPGDRSKGRLLWSNPDGWEVTEVYSSR
jgi:hypothetical protein